MFSVSDIEGFNLEVPLKRYFLPSLQWLMIAVFYVDQLRHTWVFLIAWSWGRQKGWASWGSEIHVESKESRPTHIIGYWSLVPYNRMDKWWSGNHQSKVFSAITTKQSSFIRLILRLSLSLIFFLSSYCNVNTHLLKFLVLERSSWSASYEDREEYMHTCTHIGLRSHINTNIHRTLHAKIHYMRTQIHACLYTQCHTHA